MKDYEQNNCIDKLQKLSSSELEKYAKYIDQLILDDPTNYKLFEYVDNLYKLWISKDNDNETAYHMYLDILRLTNHYYEAYSICKKLIEEKKFQSMVYKQLSDFGYVCDGVISFDQHLEYIRNALNYCVDEEQKKELKALLEYEENLWK